MAYSLQREVSDGTLQYVNITISYFNKEDLFVYKDGLVVPKVTDDPAAEWTYTWDGNRIKINKVVPLGSEILVRRKTPYAVPMHVYRQGAVFKDSTMDDNFLQMLFINQENVEGLTATDFYNDLDFHGYRLKNVGAAKVGTDAVPYSQYVADALGAGQNRIAAEQARDTTEGFKTEAQAATATAKEWANKLGATVDATEYSAKYYSIKANEYSVSAKNSKDAAAVSETNALQSENNTALLKTQTQQIIDQAQGLVDQIAEVNSLVNDVKGARLPVGVIVPFPEKGTYPGYLYLDGSSFDTAVYTQLAKMYPSGKLPDMRSASVTGVDDGKGKFTDKTAKTFLESQNLSHTHVGTGATDNNGGHTHTGATDAQGDHWHKVYYNGSGGSVPGFNGPSTASTVSSKTANAGSHTHNVTINQAGSHTHDVTVNVAASGGTESRPYSYTVYWYIKAVDSVGQPEVIQAQDLVNRVAALEAKVPQSRYFDGTSRTVSGTTSAQEYILGKLYANEHATKGQTVKVIAKGKRNTGSNGTLTFRLVVGNVVCCTVILPTTATATATFAVEFEILCYQDGDYQRFFGECWQEGAAWALSGEAQQQDRTETWVANDKTVVLQMIPGHTSDSVLINDIRMYA